LSVQIRWLAVSLLAFGVANFSVATSSAQSNTIPAADTALTNGDYDTAVTEYSAAVNDPALKCAALYGLGTAHYRAERYIEAGNAFAQNLNECERTFRPFVMYAQALQALDRVPEALAAYQAAQALNPVLDSYLYERMAALSPDQSVQYLRLAAEGARQSEGKFALREKLAQVFMLIGSPDAALSEYDSLLGEIAAYLNTLSTVEGAEFDRPGTLRARLEYAAAEIELQLGRSDAAYARMQRIITDYWQTPSALPALIDLVTAAQPVDLLQRMRINVRNENYTPVIGVLTETLANPSSTSAPAELMVLLGQAQRGTGDTDAALASFAGVLAAYPTDPAAITAALEQGNTYLQRGDAAQAVISFTTLVNANPQAPEARAALLRAAETERDFGDINRALELYTQLGTQYGGTEEAQTGLFEAGMVLAGSDPARAAQLFGQAGTARGFVWQGRLLSQTGDTAGAQQAWQAGVNAEPDTYFGVRACELLTGRSSLGILPMRTIDTSGDRAEAEAWVAQTFNLPGVSSQLAPELASDPMLQRGTELWALGLWAEARAELDALHKLNRTNPAALLQLAFHYQSIGINRSSVNSATRLIYNTTIPVVDIPESILRLAYPMYFSDMFLPRAAEENLDPLLVAGLIRQESSYDPTVISVVGARGLMQFMPPTAQDMAEQLGYTDYELDDLFRPIVSIDFGTHYLSSMRDYQGGSDVGALLSYNAGPGAARVWLDQAGSDLELLYETINYAETQLYLDLIYTNHYIYQRLYTEGAPDCRT
jgi:soluble lytic murein transglycosylase